MIKISVIIPVYNCEKYIDRCVNSLLNQSLDGVEIILVDDGSTDKSLEKCLKYEKEYPNVVVIHQENSGAAKARIEGIRRAGGEFVGFVDSDDWVHSDMYDILYNTAIENGADIVQCGFKKVDDYDDNYEVLHRSSARVYSSREGLMQLFGADGRDEFNYLLWNKIFRTSAIQNVELPVYIKTINDVPFIPRLFFASNRVAAIDEPLVYYFMRNEESNKSITDELRTSKEKLVWSHIKSFNDISLYFKERDRELYLASLRHTVAWALTAVKSRGFSKECKRYAWKEVIKKSEVRNNKYIPKKKRIVATILQLL